MCFALINVSSVKGVIEGDCLTPILRYIDTTHRYHGILQISNKISYQPVCSENEPPFNSSRPSDACMRQKTKLLILVRACRLFDAKPFSELMLAAILFIWTVEINCQWNAKWITTIIVPYMTIVTVPTVLLLLNTSAENSKCPRIDID